MTRSSRNVQPLVQDFIKVFSNTTCLLSQESVIAELQGALFIFLTSHTSSLILGFESPVRWGFFCISKWNWNIIARKWTSNIICCHALEILWAEAFVCAHSCVLHIYMLLLLHKGTWQNPGKHVLLVNWLDVLLKKVLGEIGLVSFVFPQLPSKFGHRQKKVSEVWRVDLALFLLKNTVSAVFMEVLTFMKIKWTIFPVHVYRSGQAAASQCHGLSPLQYYACAMIVIFLSTKSWRKGCRLHILSDYYLIEKVWGDFLTKEGNFTYFHMLCLMLLNILSWKTTLCDTGVILGFSPDYSTGVAVAGIFKHLITCPRHIQPRRRRWNELPDYSLD